MSSSDFYDYGSAMVTVCLRDFGEASAICVSGVSIKERAVLPNGTELRFQVTRRTPTLEIVHLERFSLVPFEQILAAAAGLARAPRLGLAQVEMLVDTGPASAQALESLTEDDGIDATVIQLVGERSGTYANGVYRTPRRDVIGALVSCMHRRVINIASGLDLSEPLAGALSELTLRAIDDDSIDSLVMALAMSAWRMNDTFDTDDQWADAEPAEESDGEWDPGNWGLN